MRKVSQKASPAVKVIASTDSVSRISRNKNKQRKTFPTFKAELENCRLTLEEYKSFKETLTSEKYGYSEKQANQIILHRYSKPSTQKLIELHHNLINFFDRPELIRISYRHGGAINLQYAVHYPDLIDLGFKKEQIVWMLSINGGWMNVLLALENSSTLKEFPELIPKTLRTPIDRSNFLRNIEKQKNKTQIKAPQKPVPKKITVISKETKLQPQTFTLTPKEKNPSKIFNHNGEKPKPFPFLLFNQLNPYTISNEELGLPDPEDQDEKHSRLGYENND